MRQIGIRPWHGGLVVLLAACVAAVLFLANSQPNRAATPLPEPSPEPRGPITIVSLGDSSVSGEGTGIYTSTTNGQGGNWCHRSPKAMVHVTSVPGIDKTVNLACSGAATAHVALTKQTKYTEGSQAARLRELAKTHEIEVVVVAVGANDDPRFSHHLSACAKAWFGGPLCTEALRENWTSTVDAMVPKVVTALNDVRTVLAQVGYDREDYQLVVQSYPSPVSPRIPESLRNLDGCPFRTADLEWIRGTAVPELSRGMREAAEAVGARFLDLSRAGYGHEACTGGSDASNEWFTRLTVRWDDLDDVDRASHAAQESFHLNVAGHAQIGRCMTEFLADTTSEAACREGTDGELHPTVLP
ncbi:GDSL-type esterase/lipase family protein [Haloechinothrix salitolerans]|uniref:GDSL-type esterase/lipase family protein n=1 Tax=Haloechinothrix salitolerans TaxID=926830 RepID=A0ABW2C043_9PSEU